MRKDTSKDKFENLKESVNQFGKQYKGKSEDDLIKEVKKIRSNMSDEEFRRQINSMNKIRGFLNEQQQRKLDKLIKMLEKNK